MGYDLFQDALLFLGEAFQQIAKLALTALEFVFQIPQLPLSAFNDILQQGVLEIEVATLFNFAPDFDGYLVVGSCRQNNN